jgi:predicted  nucleic acid-binding Zn-ribbon protein
MNELMQNLVKLQSLQFGDMKEKNSDATMAELRNKIPAQIIAHYDRLAVRGKKGVALVREQVCTGCHMRLPMAVIMNLMHGRDIQLCDNCGRYLYLPPVAAAAPEAPPVEAAPKPVKKARKPRPSLNMV